MTVHSLDCRPPGGSVQGFCRARILEWVAIPFSRGSSRPRDQTWISSVAVRFFTVWATGEAPLGSYKVTTFSLGPDAHRTLCEPYKNSFCYPTPMEFLPSIPTTFKARCCWGCSSHCQTSRLGNLTWGSVLSFLWENLCNTVIFQFVGQPDGFGIWFYSSCSPLPSCCVCFVFGCWVSFLVGFSISLLMVFWQLVGILVSS